MILQYILKKQYSIQAITHFTIPSYRVQFLFMSYGIISIFTFQRINKERPVHNIMMSNAIKSCISNSVLLSIRVDLINPSFPLPFSHIYSYYINTTKAISRSMHPVHRADITCLGELVDENCLSKKHILYQST